jgi:hypothetical protein
LVSFGTINSSEAVNATCQEKPKQYETAAKDLNVLGIPRPTGDLTEQFHRSEEHGDETQRTRLEAWIATVTRWPGSLLEAVSS